MNAAVLNSLWDASGLQTNTTMYCAMAVEQECSGRAQGQAFADITHSGKNLEVLLDLLY